MSVRKGNRTSKLVVLVSLVLFIVNISLGTLLTLQAGAAMKTQVQSRMLDIANVAAGMLDGDILAALEAEDGNTPGYRTVMESLTYFQDNIELSYIYCIRQEDDGSFTFSVDPTVEDPAEFGEPVVYTDALYRASQGIAAVDDRPYEDDWGRFYSAYSPVFTSAGGVGGIVAVDFSADWYEQEISKLIVTFVAMGLISMLFGVLIVLVITQKNRRQYIALHGHLQRLGENIETLVNEIEYEHPDADAIHEKYRQMNEHVLQSDNMNVLGNEILLMQEDLHTHIERIRKQAYVDPLTGVGNRTAYVETLKYLEQQIAEHRAQFALALFDVNGLKTINDTFGHEIGDEALVHASECLKKVFGLKQVYRIGGDEFMVILQNVTEEDMQELSHRMDEEIDARNRMERPYDEPLAISRGMAVYDPETDADYASVAQRADQLMYEDKRAFYQIHADRRRR